MLTLIQCFDLPGHMQMVGHRVVNCIHIEVSEYGVIAFVRTGIPQFLGGGLRTAVLTGSDGDHFAVLGFWNGGDDFGARDVRGAEDTPTDFFHTKYHLTANDFGLCLIAAPARGAISLHGVCRARTNTVPTGGGPCLA